MTGAREHGGRLRGGCRFGTQRPFVDTHIQTVDRLFVPPWNEMPIEIHGDLDGTMAHLVFFDGHSVSGRQSVRVCSHELREVSLAIDES